VKEEQFKKLLKSIDEGREIHAGKRKSSSTFHITPVEIKLIRHKLHVSQGLFARWIGINPATLRNWEQGRAYPDAAARALLRVAAIRPDAIQEALGTI
jgi:putative transcriptional regulator